jgi:hypothetical protein
MDAIDRIRAIISDFGGYAEAVLRRASDEQIRAFAGEALAAASGPQIEGLAADVRLCYDRTLLRCEFINQDVFHVFDSDPTVERVRATLEADLEVLEAAAALREAVDGEWPVILVRLHDAFEQRDAAMRSQ